MSKTAHAVMTQNYEDGGDRKFILVQIQEPLKTEEQYAKSICDLGKSRIRNVSKALRAKFEEGGDLFKSDKNNIDLGMKILRLDQSNFKQWQTSTTQLSTDQLSQ